jgi:hypothetical protein
MTWDELKDWVLKTQTPDEQVEMYVQEDVKGEEECIIEGVGPVFNVPFVGYTCEWPEGPSSKLHITLWEDEYFQKYTWQNLVDWIETIENKDADAISLCAYHALKLKPISEDRLYAYEET